MHFEELSEGGAIELEVKCNGKNMNFKSEIAYIRNGAILINTIKVNEQTVGFSEKFQINFLYKFEGKLYLWENVSVKLVKLDGIIYHKIDLYGDGKPYNRRDAYRMYVGEDMPVYVNTAIGPTALSVLVKDISETGVGFISKDDMDIERTIRLKLKDNNTVINVSGVIVRKEFLTNLGAFLYGCKFNEKNLQLAKYITKKQSEMLRKKSESMASSRDRTNRAKKPEFADKR